MLVLGDTALLTFDVGEPAESVNLTITLPDGSEETPDPVGDGVYNVAYITTQVGRHTVYWHSIDPDKAFTDIIDVRSATSVALAPLADVKVHLNIRSDDTSEDGELPGFIASATDVIEDIVGAVVRRQLTETYSGNGQAALMLRHSPVISIEQVVENGQPVDPSGYSLSEAGILYRVAGYRPTGWQCGRNNVTITAVVGTPQVPPAIVEAAKELVRVNFRPQQGGNYGAFDQGAGDDFGTESEFGPQGQVRLGFYVPNRVMQLLAAHAAPSGIA